MKTRIPALITSLLLAALLAGCPGNQESTGSESAAPAASESSAAAPAAETADDGKGVGPVKSVTIAAVDPAMAAEGKALFEAKCTACHKLGEKYVGPALKGVTERRKPEWVMNMILNPTEMTQKDPEAKKLFAQFMIQMTNQSVDEKAARALLEYFRSIDAG